MQAYLDEFCYRFIWRFKEALLILEVQPGMLESEEVRIVKRFLSEQSITEPENGKLIPKPKKEIPSGSLQSAHDEDATFCRKGDVSQSGYVLEISETCNKENTFQLITDYATVHVHSGFWYRSSL